MPALAGCQAVIFDPQGEVGHNIKWGIITTTLLMLIVVIPVIIMTFVFAWRYRASNTKATYEPNWAHSNKIEVVVWGIPCVIIIILVTITYMTSHSLDPYRPLAKDTKPINVEVVSLDWKWLFIYPDLKIASVNELAFPDNVPVNFSLTSATVMSSFFIPALGSMIYTMPAMTTKLHLIADHPGTFEGASSNYNGAGFSDMHFLAHAMNQSEFDAWVAKVRGSTQTLDIESYKKLAVGNHGYFPITYYGSVTDGMFGKIVHSCMQKGTDLCWAGAAREPEMAQKIDENTTPSPSKSGD